MVKRIKNQTKLGIFFILIFLLLIIVRLQEGNSRTPHLFSYRCTSDSFYIPSGSISLKKADRIAALRENSYVTFCWFTHGHN